MGKLWICLILATLAAVHAQKSAEEWNPEQWDYYDDTYDSPLLYDDNLKELVEKIFDDKENQPVEPEIADDYQIEDNRSSHNDGVASKEKESEPSSKEVNVIEEVIAEEAQKESKDEEPIGDDEAGFKEVAEFLSEEKTNDLADKDTDTQDEDNVVALSEEDAVDMQNVDVPEENKQDDQNEIQHPGPDDNIFEETKELLDDTYNGFEDGDDVPKEPEQDQYLKLLKDEDMHDIEEDTVDKVYEDLNADLDKLMETWKKLNVDTEQEINPDDAFDPKEASKENKDTDAASQEEQIADIARKTVKIDTDIIKKDQTSKENKEGSKDESFEKQQNDDEVDDVETNNEDVIKENNDEANADDINYVKIDEVDADDGNYDDIGDDDAIDEEANDDYDEKDDEKDDEEDDEVDDEEFSDNDDTIDKVADNIEETNDAAAMFNMNDDSYVASKSDTPQTSDASTKKESSTTEAVRTVDVTELTSEQYDQLIAQFKLAHSEVFDLNNDESDNVAAIHITLSLDEATVVTSPNYPSPYPTNNVVDWIFDGEGVGIELNITDLAVNGALGDYILIKPGGVDATGTDGLVFSYRLQEPRLYRFLDVSRMFIRFVSLPGMAFNRGFSLSAKMIAPIPVLDEDIPEPEALLPEPENTITLFIGGMPMGEFRSYLEQFRLILADMATMYINANEIDPGLNTTRETTQILRTGVCNVNWPGYKHCTRVTFGVPLIYEELGEEEEPRLNEEDLRAMWDTYRGQDPFASRLSSMGMNEFAAPSDRSAIIIWALVGLSFVVFMTLMGLALWRFSCFENYSRMPQYSDRDSIYSAKQGLDLYPTPHQTLPPLYAENEYKWDDGKFDDTARVDLGGFTNKSYAQDMYDMDSDDDIIIAPRPDRKSSSAKNTYEV